nr:RNA-directed DNA polymerase, eukaryota, reverse transcriptase zinc-binding domain protein [Tanacetum cinerariifolium]
MNDLTSLENNVSLELAQKAKIKWAIEGDENSKFFYGIINKHQNNLAVRGIIADGEWIEEPNAVKNEFFLTLGSIRASIPFSMEEVKGAMWGCGLNKLPGPDGFTFEFYRRYWSLIEDDVPEAVNYFFQYGYCHEGGNSFFIALISKIPDAKMVKDFRPIIGSLYKIIAKLLANHLVTVMSDLVKEV